MELFSDFFFHFVYIHTHTHTRILLWASPMASSKESAFNAGDATSISGLGRSLGEGNGNPLQYSCLRNPIVRGARGLQYTRLQKSWT